MKSNIEVLKELRDIGVSSASFEGGEIASVAFFPEAQRNVAQLSEKLAQQLPSSAPSVSMADSIAVKNAKIRLAELLEQAAEDEVVAKARKTLADAERDQLMYGHSD